MAGPSGTWELYDRTGTYRVDRRYVQGGAVETVQAGTDITTVGTPVTYFEIAGDGRDLPGIAWIVASNVNVGVSPHRADWTIHFAGARHPYEALTVTNVACDASTVNEDIWPGYQLKFTSSASLANGWTAVLYGGLWSRTILSAGNPNAIQWNEQDGLFDPGELGSGDGIGVGDPGVVWTCILKNASAESQDGCVIKRYPTEVLYDKVAPKVFRYIQTVTDAPVEDTAVGGKLRPYKFSAQGRSGGLGHVEMAEDPYSSWAEVDVRNISTGATGTSHNLAFDDATEYVITSGDAEGTLFCLASAATNSSIENLTVTSDEKYFEMGAGAAPSSWEEQSLAISQTGRSDQVFLAAGTALISFRITPDALASEDQNPFAIRLYVESNRTGSAGYAD